MYTDLFKLHPFWDRLPQLIHTIVETLKHLLQGSGGFPYIRYHLIGQFLPRALKRSAQYTELVA